MKLSDILVLVPFASAGDTGMLVLAVCALVTLAVAIVLYLLCSPRSVGNNANGARGFRAFLSFDKLCLRSMVRFFYLLGAVGGVVLFIGMVVLMLTGRVALYGYLSVPATCAIVFACIVAYEIVLRAACELVFALCRMADDVACLRAGTQEAGEGDCASEQPGSTPCKAVAVDSDAVPVGQPVPTVLPTQPMPVSDTPKVAADPIVEQVAPMDEEPSVEASAAYGEIPTVFDASTYDEYASRGAFAEYEASPEGTAPTMPVGRPDYGDAAPTSVLPPVGYGFPAWDCVCGSRGNTGAYCGQCGCPRDRAVR